MKGESTMATKRAGKRGRKARAQRQADTGHQEKEPAAGSKTDLPPQDLPGDDRRHEALREMPDPVVVIASEAKGILHPETQRDLSIGVVPAHHQDQRVEFRTTVFT